MLQFFDDSTNRQIILEDLYNRNCNNIKEWTILLSNFSTEEISTFEFDKERIDVTPELHILLYKLNKNIDSLKDTSVILALTSSDSNKQISITVLENAFHTEDDKNEWVEYAIKKYKCFRLKLLQ